MRFETRKAQGLTVAVRHAVTGGIPDEKDIGLAEFGCIELSVRCSRNPCDDAV